MSRAGRSLTDVRGVKPLDHEIGARMRARRRELSMSQQEVADALGLSFQQIQKYERGGNRISASTLVEIAKLLRCGPEVLLGTAQTAGEIDWSRFRDSGAQDAAAAFSTIGNPSWRKAALDLLRELGRPSPSHEKDI